MLGSEALTYVTAPVEIVHASEWVAEPAANGRRASVRSTAAHVMCARLSPPIRFAPGTPLRLCVDARRLFFFDAGGQAIR
jgi:hypothetical protein